MKPILRNLAEYWGDRDSWLNAASSAAAETIISPLLSRNGNTAAFPPDEIWGREAGLGPIHRIRICVPKKSKLVSSIFIVVRLAPQTRYRAKKWHQISASIRPNPEERKRERERASLLTVKWRDGRRRRLRKTQKHQFCNVA